MEWSSAHTTRRLRTAERGRMMSSDQMSRVDTVMPKTPAPPQRKSAIQDQIAALQQKIRLLEYDHKACQESSSHTIKQNEETIKLLQQENKKLDQEIAQKKKREADREAKTGQVFIQLKESRLHDNIKRYNALCHQAQVRMKRLEELESLLRQKAIVKQNNKTTKEEQIQTLLENKLEEAQLKLQDAKHINSVYKKMIGHLQEEMPAFLPQIQQLDKEILLFRNELKDIKRMKKNAVMSRGTAWERYKHLRKEYRSICRNKGQMLRELAHQAKEMRNYEKEGVISGLLTKGPAPINAYEVSPVLEEEERISVYKEALEKILVATGAIDIGEVLQRFNKQDETHKYLEKAKLTMEQTLSDLKDKQETMHKALQELKYSGQAKLQAMVSKNIKTLKELGTQLQLESGKQDKFKTEAEKTEKVLSKATSEVKRLAMRLWHIKAPGINLPVNDFSLDLHVLDLLSIIGQTLQKLQKQLEGQDMEESVRRMKENNFLYTIERNLPASSMSISLLSPNKQDLSDEDSEEDCDVMTRANIKKMSQQIIRSNRRACLWCEKWIK